MDTSPPLMPRAATTNRSLRDSKPGNDAQFEKFIRYVDRMAALMTPGFDRNAPAAHLHHLHRVHRRRKFGVFMLILAYPANPCFSFKLLTSFTYLCCAWAGFKPSSATFCHAFFFAFSYSKTVSALFTFVLHGHGSWTPNRPPRSTYLQFEHAWLLRLLDRWVLRALLEETVELGHPLLV